MPTVSAQANLRSVALALTLHMPVLLEGATGAGKTALLEHLAHTTGHSGPQNGLLKIQMGDQTDAKVSVGVTWLLLSSCLSVEVVLLSL